MGWREDWRNVTWWLIFSVLAFSWGDLLFGIDTAAFSALQVLPAWRRDFATLEPDGTYSIANWQTAIMNSVVFAGSFLGCASFEPICERFGYKITIYVAGFLQVIAVTVELTAKNWITFTIGRIIGYIGVGLVESASPGYCSEISPAALRGFMSGSMTVLVTMGNTIGVGVCIPFREEIRSLGWMVPVGIQFLPAVGILAMVPWCPESPRWLIQKGRDNDALKALNKLRKQHEVDAGFTAAEVEAIKAEVEYVKTMEKGRWIDLFSQKYIKRTFIVMGLFFFYQTTGGQFANVYGPTFYRSLGLGPQLFSYQTVGQAVGVVASLIGILLIDRIGRRPPILFGASMLLVCNILIGSLGPQQSLSSAGQGVVIASIMLLLSGLKLSFQCGAFLLASEIGGNRMRKKFMGFGTTIDVIFRFGFTFAVPYLLNANPGLGLGARFGFVMAVIAAISIVFVYLMVPETMGRALEEMDELFAMKIWPWQWRKAQTTGVGAQVANAERGNIATTDKTDPEKNLEIYHTENAAAELDDESTRARRV